MIDIIHGDGDNQRWRLVVLGTVANENMQEVWTFKFKCGKKSWLKMVTSWCKSVFINNVIRLEIGDFDRGKLKHAKSEANWKLHALVGRSYGHCSSIVGY